MSETHRWDAGDMGCAEGLAKQWRKHLEAIPPGDVLETVARDPSAREDLPAMARLLGHVVVSSEVGPDATIVVTVERANSEKEG